jgi:eukaryotic-like serine/threonine-protein kinase
VQYGAALVFAVASHNRVQSLMEDLAKRFPEDTIVQFIYLPTIQAQLALNRDNAADAISLLQAATPFELGSTGISTSFTSALYPIFVRGNAYLAARHGSEAAAEFQKILQWRGVPTLGWRANSTQGNTSNAKSAYQDFLTRWKVADADIPIYKQAKSEYGKLK